MNLYKILGIDKKADDETIKKAYRKLSKIHHPDVGGSKEKLADMVLQDPESLFMEN